MDEGVEKMVVSGSLSAVGYLPGSPSDESMPFNPFENHMPYAFSKVGVEQECLKAAVDGFPVVVAISCAILGPWDFKPSRMGRVLVDFANGRMRAYIQGGFEFVTTRYIFGSGFLTVEELMALYERVTGRRRPMRIPAAVMAGVAPVSSFVLTNFFPDVPQRFTPASVRLLRLERRADCTKACRELGFCPTSIEEAIREAYDWFVERGAIQRLVPARAREVRMDS
jgi:nucleoside-diphosphate-sugar epimerase